MNRKDGNRERESETFMADLSFAAISEQKINLLRPGPVISNAENVSNAMKEASITMVMALNLNIDI